MKKKTRISKIYPDYEQRFYKILTKFKNKSEKELEKIKKINIHKRGV